MADGSASGSPLGDALRRYVDARNAAIIDARRVLHVNELDARALMYIAANPGTRPGHLRDYLGITSAGVTTLIDRLVERDTVRRDVDPDDRRINRISITVDMATEPWSALHRFDDAFDVAATRAVSNAGEAARLALILDEFTAAASSVPA